MADNSGIKLFEHNETAYISAAQMLKETGKAAVIHPTGTGKSFIAFKLCYDNAAKKICWLSPGEYIFKTQCENLAAAGSAVPNNIAFFTYAKLMLMSDTELEEINPDYIILDEFHRCGAEMWGQGVNRLLNIYSDTPVLGLTATNIRYLDNRRDMADELFDGNIASEMTLGEAIVRGILNPPKYVLSVFGYGNEFKKYEQKIRNARSKAVRAEGEKYLDALKRALDKADGLDRVFAKHMPKRDGKYIVFCASFDHMNEMADKAKDWFAKVDSEPHIYKAYSNDPATSKAFSAFKADVSKHLKLLYSIDMLNEGIHVDDVDGVILLRPTVSPIIYKQQIGRALSAGKKSTPVIFDIVLNIENLYSIGAVEEEMQIATAYYRSLGEESSIVNDSFSIYDEVKDCRELFSRLNDILTVSWQTMFEQAKKYYLENGDLEVPARFITNDGYSLGHWIYNQRAVRKGQQTGNLSEEQIEKLNSIGMRWDLYTDYSWEKNFNAAKDYYEKNGHLDVPSRFVTRDGLPLGAWLSSLRTWESSGIHPKYLSAERKKQLESIGMIWSKLDYYWEQNFSEALRYYRENGDLLVPSNFVTDNGVRLGSWIFRQRKLHSGSCKGTPLTTEQTARLNSIGMVWDSNTELKWSVAYGKAKRYYEKNNDLDIPRNYKSEDGYALGQWMVNQRKFYENGTLKNCRKGLLDKIGMVWEPENPWLMRFNLVKSYYEEHGNINISQSTVVNGVWLGKWIAEQKKKLENEKLSDKQREYLNKLPLENVGTKDRQWRLIYKDAVNFYKENGNLKVPSDFTGKSGFKLSDWLVRQRRSKNAGELSSEKIELLEKIGFSWQLETVWDEGYRHAKDYFDKNGNLDIPSAYKCEDGYALGKWVFNCRKARNGMKSQLEISNSQADALEKIGMNWHPDTQWDKKYKTALDYYKINGHVPLSASAKNEDAKKIAVWLNNQRKSYRLGNLSNKQLEMLSELGITKGWLSKSLSPFEKGFSVAEDYYKKNGNLNVATNYQAENGFWLGSWVDKIRKKKDKLTPEQKSRLDSIGFVWQVTDEWEYRFSKAEQYYLTNGKLPLEPKQCKNNDELNICRWLRRQLVKRRNGTLQAEKEKRLSAIGMDWLTSNERAWNRGYSKAKDYYDRYGNLNVKVGYICPDGYPLGEWLHSQRSHGKGLESEKIHLLSQINFTESNNNEQ